MTSTVLALVTPGAIAPAPAAEEEGKSSPSSQSLSLRSLVEELDALIETVELVQPEDEADFLKRFQETHLATKAKIDRTGDFLDFVDSQIAAAKAKAALLHERQSRWAMIKDRLEHYLVSTITSRDPDPKGKYKPLEGNTTTLGVRKLPPSLAPIADESLVPADYQDVTITLPRPLWDKLLDAIPMDSCTEVLEAVKKPSITIRRAEIKSAITKGGKVDGCGLNPTGYKLVVS